MKLQHRWLALALALSTLLVFVPAACRAQLLSPGDFNGQSLDEWTSDWGEWAIATGLAGQTLPDTVNDVRYLPPNFGSSFVADVTITQGTAVVFSPYFVFGEKYDDGTEDLPGDIDGYMLFENATFQTTYDGNVVLEGLASAFPARKSSIRVYSPPLTYLTPQDRGSHDAIAAIFGQGLGAMFEVPHGEHEITNVYSSTFFGGPFSTTYNITVVPEPSTWLLTLGVGIICCIAQRKWLVS